MITNISLTGVRNAGSRDRLELSASQWRTELNDIHIWDASDLSSMLDNCPGVRQTYLDAVLPGDILAAMLRRFEGDRRRVQQILRGYLDALVDPDGAIASARTTEAGDDSDKALRLKDVYVDLPVAPITGRPRLMEDLLGEALSAASRQAGTPESPVEVGRVKAIPASLALLACPSETTLLLAGPGYGKSTLSQFLALYHAARIVDWAWQDLLPALGSRLQLPHGLSLKVIETLTTPRLPFRIELRRYAEWLRDSPEDPGIARYIVERLVRPKVEGTLSHEDFFLLADENPLLLILDGLDEVPSATARTAIVDHLKAFLRRVRKGANSDIQVVLSSRPQGYNQEFLTFEPTTWAIQDLDTESLDRYCTAWLAHRIRDDHERIEARKRIDKAITAPEVQRLATTLLQVTVMLSLARSRKDIPHERTTLFARFVDVVFERERDKWPHVRPYERELRRLHGEAAYRIQREMEVGRPDALPEDDFRALALRTWEAFRGDDVQSGSLRTAVDAIIETAKDRLVFLKGQGDDQSNIGFLLASYREYFAADYLRSHERADRDRVFDALIDREAHWENVIRFYAGFQEPAVQVDWIDRIADCQPASSVESLIRVVRRRRLLLKLLPEFRELQRQSFQRALTEIVQPDTLWSWFGQEWATEILRGVRGGETMPWAYEKVSPLLSSADPPTFAAALEIALGLHNESGSPLESCVERLRSRMDEGGAIRAVIVNAVLMGHCWQLSDAIVPGDLDRSSSDTWRYAQILDETPDRLAVDLQILRSAHPYFARREDLALIGPSLASLAEVPVGSMGLGFNEWLFGISRISPKVKALLPDLREPTKTLTESAIRALERPADWQANDAARAVWTRGAA